MCFKTTDAQRRAKLKWYYKNKGYYLQKDRNWRANNPEKSKAKVNARRKRLKVQTPKWVNWKELEIIYLNRPKSCHVDHIIPIKGTNVSGLHVPWNLQYLPAAVNQSKGNKI